MKQAENITPYTTKSIFHSISNCALGGTTPEKLDTKLARDSRGINSLYKTELGTWSILHYVIVYNGINILPVLEKYIDYSLFQTRSSEGETPLMCAITFSRLETAQAIVESHKRYLQKRVYNQAAINEEIAETVNIPDNEEKTSLHYAAEFHSVDKIKFLLSLGADTTIKDKFGNMPLYYAASTNSLDKKKNTSEKKKIEAIACLVQNAEELYKEDKSGMSYLEIIRKSEESWGYFQEQELLKACNKDAQKRNYCTIS